MLPQLLADSNVGTVYDMVKLLRKQSPVVRELFGEVVKLMCTRLILVIPATSVCAERSFSQLKRLKTWLRSIMTQSRLTHIALAHCHQEIMDELSINDLCDEFVGRTSERRKTIGHCKFVVL